MKRGFLLFFTLTTIFTVQSKAQAYKTAGGLTVEFGDGATLVGPGVKYFFSEGNAISGEVLFGGGATFLQAFYQYQKSFPSAKNLQWYLGGGPSLGIGNGNTAFNLRPMAGLDYKLADVPLACSFDWRPNIYLGSNSYGSRFTAARFGIGIKYVIN